MRIDQHVISSESVDTAAQRVCAWMSRQKPDYRLLAVSQVAVDGAIYTTLFSTADVDSAADNEKRRPRTGEKRLTRLPLKMDKLPNSVVSAITYLRKQGKKWHEIEILSMRDFNPDWASNGGGFVDWESLSNEVRQLFPRRRLPKSSLQRWYDIRVEQGTAL